MKENINTSLSIKGSIQGSLTESDGTTPLQDISVSAYIWDGCCWSKVVNTTTDINGNYTISNLPDGYYRVEFYDNSGKYAIQHYNQRSNHELAQRIHIENGENITSIDGSLSLVGHITGKVTESDGKTPCECIRVHCKDVNNTYSEYVETDRDGNYHFGGLVAGRYYIKFEDILQGYPPLFYNNRTDRESADIIEVAAGETVSGIDAPLVMGGEIRGKVTLPDEKTPVKGAKITVHWQYNDYYDRDGSLSTQFSDVCTVTTDYKGNYKIIGLASGTYMIQCQTYELNKTKKDYQRYAIEYWIYNIDVSVDNIITGVNFSLSLPGSIQGKVVGPDGITPLKGIRVSEDPSFFEGSWIDLMPQTDAKGIYNISTLAPGRYKLHFFDDSGKYLSKTATNVIEVKPEETSINVDTCLSLAGHIQGRVTNNNSTKPLKGISVSASYHNSVSKYGFLDSWIDYRKTIAYTHTDINGNYDIGGLDSEIYNVTFGDMSKKYLKQYYNKRSISELADGIQVIAGNTVTGIDIALREYKRKRISPNLTKADWG